MKTVIFNVGGALCSYVEHDEMQIVIDLGKSQSFSPVNDFLLPLFEKKKYKKVECEGKKRYRISQLIISHPHKDHVSDIIDFDKHFYPYLLSSPNDKSSIRRLNVNWKEVTTPDDPDVKCLINMMKSRNLPLKAIVPEFMTLSYIYPKDVEDSIELNSESYTNNISIAIFLKSTNYRVFFPGDLQKEGMKELLNSSSTIKKEKANILIADLKQGVDFLITPHHGLCSSFSTELFNTMKNKKTKKLNIVSEKATTDGSTRQVDTRYSNTQYCEADNNLSDRNKPVCQRKTSNGHIFIDENGDVTITSDIQEIINKF